MSEPAASADVVLTHSSPKETVLELVEYRSKELLRPKISAADGRRLWELYGKKVEVTFPNPATNDCWKLVSLGWVGSIPVSPTLRLSLEPKTPLGNLFRMLEYAYDLQSFQFLAGLHDASSIADFYERLANVLALRVLTRARQGFYRTYVADADTLPYLRGNLELEQRLRQPWAIQLPCHFQEHTADVDENQILLWALRCVLRSGLCSERVLPTVRRAFRTLQGTADLVPFSADDCTSRLYNRLNLDYRPLHALARFFIEQSGPTSAAGDRDMVPYLVDMSSLFELFVARWLRQHLPPHLEIRSQATYAIDANIRFKIDLVLCDRASSQPIAVLDTKYKTPDSPSAADVSQVISYAVAKSCQEAILIYPEKLAKPVDARVGGEHGVGNMVGSVRVRSLTFDLGGDLEAAGCALLAAL